MKRRMLLKNAAIILGGIGSTSVAQAVLAGVDGRAQINNSVFTSWQKSAITILSEMIIPRTDTPGAIDAGVPHFVEMMVSDWYTDTERKIFFDGLLSLDDFCKDQFETGFINTSAKQQITALEKAEELSEQYVPDKPASLVKKHEDEKKPFFSKIKELVVLGYFTSEVGAQEELQYNPMPMKYDDIEFSEVGKQWSS